MESFLHAQLLAQSAFDKIPLINMLVAPWEWYLALPTWAMIVVAIAAPLLFYFVFRLVFKVIESITGLFG